MSNGYDLSQSISSAMAENGYVVPRPIIDCKIHRFRMGDSKKKDAWYCFYSDGIPSGSYGDWKTGLTFKWSAKSDNELTPHDRQQFKERMDQIRQKREKLQSEEWEKAATRADEVWESGKDVTDHPYLSKKQVLSHGLKLDSTGRLIIPVWSKDERLQSLQFVDANGIKRFLPGGKMAGGFFLIDGKPDRVAIVEGYATGATIAAACESSVYIAFNAGNLKQVAQIVKDRHPNARITIYADNDQWTDGNPGLIKGREAAESICAFIKVPVFRDTTTKPTDFNDLMVLEGTDELKRQVSIKTDEKPKESYFSHVSELPDPKAEWLIKYFIEKNCLAEIFGPTGSYKSFMAIHAGMCTGSGYSFFGLKIKDPGPVLFIIGEGHSGFKKRLKAWCLWHNFNLDSLPIHISKHPAELTIDSSVNEVVTGIQEVINKYGNEPKLIVVDTLNRNFGPGDENGTADMTKFIKGCDSLRNVCNSAILIVHHSGNYDKERSRGNSALPAAIDFRYRIDPNKDESINLIFLKCKDYEIPKPRTFQKKVIDLGIVDDDGDPITSCILEQIGLNTDNGQDRTGKGSKQTKMKRILEEMVNERDQALINSGHKPQCCVPLSDWIERCNEAGCTRKDRFNNKDYFNSLIADGFIYSKLYI